MLSHERTAGFEISRTARKAAAWLATAHCALTVSVLVLMVVVYSGGSHPLTLLEMSSIFIFAVMFMALAIAQLAFAIKQNALLLALSVTAALALYLYLFTWSLESAPTPLIVSFVALVGLQSALLWRVVGPNLGALTRNL